MKIGYFGNMNNIGFTIVRYLRDLGYDIELLLYEDDYEHFLPYCDSFDLSYQSYVKPLAWGGAGRLLSMTSSEIREQIERYDVTIGCGFAPAYFNKAGKRLDIFTPYGFDIWGLIKPPKFTPLPHRWRWFKPPRLQRSGISECSVFHMSPADEMYEVQAKKLAPSAERWLEGLPMVYTSMYDDVNAEHIESRSHWGHLFRALREESDLLLVYHSRHDWTRETSDPCNKGTCRFLRGLAKFVNARKDIKVHLITVEYGRDVVASKMLLDELGIAENVTWFPKMFRKDVMAALMMADIVCGQFENNWLTYGALNEALAVSKPILTHRIDSEFATMFNELYSVMSARTDDEICSRLEDFVASPDPYVEAAKTGRQWYESFVVKPGIAKYVEFFEKNK